MQSCNINKQKVWTYLCYRSNMGCSRLKTYISQYIYAADQTETFDKETIPLYDVVDNSWKIQGLFSIANVQWMINKLSMNNEAGLMLFECSMLCQHYIQNLNLRQYVNDLAFLIINWTLLYRWLNYQTNEMCMTDLPFLFNGPILRKGFMKLSVAIGWHTIV